MRTALPFWGTEVSPVFDFAQRILVVESERGREILRFVSDLPKNSISSRAERLRELGVDVLICGAVSNTLANMISGFGVNLVSWKCGSAEEVLQAYYGGFLDDARFTMPGHRDRGILPTGT